MLIDPKTYTWESPRGFIVLEGVNGAGKTTLQKAIVAHLTSKGFTPISTREPGATPLGKTLRSLVLEGTGDKMSGLTELFIFAADRSEHVAKIISPALLAKKPVISDRYFYSAMAFQGYGRNLGADLVQQINDIAVDGVYPDAVLLLDLDPKAGLLRAAGRNDAGGADSFEKEETEFHERIRSGFLTIAENRPEPFIRLDANQSQEALKVEALSIIDRVFLKYR